MKYWIVPNSNAFFRLDDLLKNRDDVIWRHRNKFEVGDIVFIYTSTPVKRLTVLMRVEQTNVNKKDYDDSPYWGEKYKANRRGVPNLVQFKLIQKLSNQLKLSFFDMTQHGLNNNLQGIQTVSGALLEYILNEISGETTLEASPDFIIDDTTFPEGATMQVTVNKYERSREARRQCIEAHGCYCHVCGLDFAQKYGELGEGFIHVHHLVPISTIGEDYVVDPVKDLIPVCPNCHAMLHRGQAGQVLSIEQLRKIIK